MKAIPESSGVLRKKSCKASSPPAEAPIPTTGKDSGALSVTDSGPGALTESAADVFPTGGSRSSISIPFCARLTWPSQRGRIRAVRFRAIILAVTDPIHTIDEHARSGTERSGTSWPLGPGTMAALIRNHDWGATSLGELAQWPPH